MALVCVKTACSCHWKGSQARTTSADGAFESLRTQLSIAQTSTDFGVVPAPGELSPCDEGRVLGIIRFSIFVLVDLVSLDILRPCFNTYSLGGQLFLNT